MIDLEQKSKRIKVGDRQLAPDPFCSLDVQFNPYITEQITEYIGKYMRNLICFEICLVTCRKYDRENLPVFSAINLPVGLEEPSGLVLSLHESLSSNPQHKIKQQNHQ